MEEYQVISLDMDELGLFQSQELQGTVTDLIESGKNRIILDMSSVTAIKSSGMGTIVAISKRIQKEDGVLKLIGIQPTTLKLMQIARLDQFIDMHAKVVN